jgi:hypothetical protein
LETEEGRIFNREFFKWLRNLSEANHRKFCKHILNKSGDSRVYAYPKLTMKTISSVLISCYCTKEWIERHKKKQLVRRELNKMKPRLQLFGANGEFNHVNWRVFKRNYNIMTATIQKAPGEEFFSCSKQTQNKNRSVDELSPYAKEFFWVFHKQKKRFVKPARRAFFQPYIGINNKIEL